MYAPKQSREESRDVLLCAISEIRFAALIVSSRSGLDAAHLPMIARARGETIMLEGHVARSNPIWRRVSEEAHALAIFQGPQAYVRPNWLATKRQTGKAVPTWNYVAVHVHGPIAVEEEPAWLLRHVTDLTRQNENGLSHPWAVSDAPDGYIDQLARGIIGLTIAVERLEGAWKMMQHHSDENRAGVIVGLSDTRKPGAIAVAEVMRSLGRG